MRLMNVISLQRLAKDSSYQISMEGQMNFRRSHQEKFQKRYFRLKGNLLFYFAKKSDRAPIGLVIVEGYTVELSNEEEGNCFQLLRRANGSVATSLTFVVATAEAMQNWLTALTNCSYERLKISAERMAELVSTTSAEQNQDHNGNPVDNNPSTDPMTTSDTKESFEELHETYGKKIQEILSGSKGDT